MNKLSFLSHLHECKAKLRSQLLRMIRKGSFRTYSEFWKDEKRLVAKKYDEGNRDKLFNSTN